MRRNNENKASALVDQREALHSYLDALLAEVPDVVDEPEVVQAPVVQPPAEPAPLRPVVAPEPEPEPAPEPKSEPPLVAKVPAREPTQTQPVEAAESTGNTETQLPAWAEESFQCLLFKVAGLSLAVPLVHLNGVIPYPHDKVTPMPNRSALFLGLTHYQDYNVKVVDTARVVLPEDTRNGELDPPEERLSNIILTGGGEWGLACDAIGDVLTLQSADVRWRTTQGKRPWLAGTVREHLCALLDTEGMARLLRAGE